MITMMLKKTTSHSWSSADHSFLLKNLVANGEGLKERLLEVNFVNFLVDVVFKEKKHNRFRGCVLLPM